MRFSATLARGKDGRLTLALQSLSDAENGLPGEYLLRSENHVLESGSIPEDGLVVLHDLPPESEQFAVDLADGTHAVFHLHFE